MQINECNVNQMEFKILLPDADLMQNCTEGRKTSQDENSR